LSRNEPKIFPTKKIHEKGGPILRCSISEPPTIDYYKRTLFQIVGCQNIRKLLLITKTSRPFVVAS